MLRAAGHEIIDPGPTRAWDGPEDLLARADGVLAGLAPITREMLAVARGLRVIAKTGVGFDNIDLHAANEFGIVVSNTAGSNTDCVADHTIGLMLAVLRRLVELDQRTRSGAGWSDVSIAPEQLTSRHLGVIGTGSIGKAVSRRAVAGFGMTVSAFSRAPDPAFAAELNVAYRPLEDVLRNVDIISLHVPLTESTRGLIGEAELRLMRPTAVLVNTARGGVVDETALADALRQGRIAGAGVDVFASEPCTASPLFDLPNTVLTPHIAGRSPQAARLGRLMAAENLVEGLAGRPIRVVNPEVLRSPQCRIRPRGPQRQRALRPDPHHDDSDDQEARPKR